MEIAKTWQGNPDRGELFIFDGTRLVQVRVIAEPHMTTCRRWRTMTKDEVTAQGCPHLSDGIEFFTYHIRGDDDESIFDAITAPRA